MCKMENNCSCETGSEGRKARRRCSFIFPFTRLITAAWNNEFYTNSMQRPRNKRLSRDNRKQVKYTEILSFLFSVLLPKVEQQTPVWNVFDNKSTQITGEPWRLVQTENKRENEEIVACDL